MAGYQMAWVVYAEHDDAKTVRPVAWAGIERLRLGLVDGLDFAPRPRWPLEALGVG